MKYLSDAHPLIDVELVQIEEKDRSLVVTALVKHFQN